MAENKKTSSKKATSKKTAKKPVKLVKKPVKKVEEIAEVEEVPTREFPKGAKCGSQRKLGVVLLSIFISTFVAIGIIITVPLWMGKVLPPEKQPGFLRKALMPVTNVKVLKTETAPREVDEMLKKTVAEMENKLVNMQEKLAKVEKDDFETQQKDIDVLNEKVSNLLRYADDIGKSLEYKSIKEQLFLVSFYDLYNKAMSGKPYINDMNLITKTGKDYSSLELDFYWTKAYAKRPPKSLEEVAIAIEENYDEIIDENIRIQYKGFEQKAMLAMNNIFRLDVPVKDLEQGSLKYNLSMFIEAAKNNNSCGAMRYGIMLSNQSSWFKSNIFNELEARYKINKELIKAKKLIEESKLDEFNNFFENETEGR